MIFLPTFAREFPLGRVGDLAGTTVRVRSFGGRRSAHALVLNVGIGIAGGTAPMVAVESIEITHSKMAPAIYLAIACVVSCVSVLLLKDRDRESQ